jgi:hypothetical protein
VCGEHQLLLVIGAINSVGLFFGFCQSGQEHTGEDCDDRNHGQSSIRVNPLTSENEEQQGEFTAALEFFIS